MINTFKKLAWNIKLSKELINNEEKFQGLVEEKVNKTAEKVFNLLGMKEGDVEIKFNHNLLDIPLNVSLQGYAGYYDAGDGKVYINTPIIQMHIKVYSMKGATGGSALQILDHLIEDLVAHEIRHAYQDKVLKVDLADRANKLQRKIERTAKTHAESMILVQMVMEKKLQSEYWNQDIEIDARNFAKLVLKNDYEAIEASLNQMEVGK